MNSKEQQKRLKQELRDKIWQSLTDQKVAAFPFPVKGRIPNFVGAAKAADLVREQSWYKKAKVIKFNPDSPQRPLRFRALKDGKLIYMAVPKLKTLKCFIELDPKKISPENYLKAASNDGAKIFGKAVHPKEMKKIDLISAGSVVLNHKGKRIGKGAGYSDIEYGIGRLFNIVNEKTKIFSTIHDLQLVKDDWEVEEFDTWMDYIVTPHTVVECVNTSQSQGLRLDLMDKKKFEQIPILAELRESNKF